jgi:putative ABC transport system ATP-binding protein
MPKPVLELVDVSKIYTMGDQELYALKDITLTIVEGEFVAVVGPSGCGKSTFLHVASLLDHSSQGQIKIKGLLPVSIRKKTGHF